MREFHSLKGVLFQYDRWHSNWIWLPLRCLRPRPPLHLCYPVRRRDDGWPEVTEEEELSRPQPGICGRQGCMLVNNHHGLCQVRIEGTRREAVSRQREIQIQTQIYHDIQSSKESRELVGPPPSAACSSVPARS